MSDVPLKRITIDRNCFDLTSLLLALPSVDQLPGLKSEPIDWRKDHDIWYAVGEHIESRITLNALCRVSKVFNEAFTPHLYERVTLRAKDIEQKFAPGSGTTTKTANSGGLKHVKDFAFDTRLAPVTIKDIGLDDILGSRRMEHKRLYGEKIQSLYELGIIALRHMPNLTSFYVGNGLYNEETVVSGGSIFTALTDCKNLRRVSIQFEHHPWGKAFFDKCPAEYHDNPIEEWFPFGAPVDRLFGLEKLKVLTSLELYSLSTTGSMERLLQRLIFVLLRSPNLKKLGLSLALKWKPYLETVLVGENDLFFLTNIASNYSKCGGSPLSLETLRLGHGVAIEPYEEDSDYDEDGETMTLEKWKRKHYIHKLLDITALETVHAYNWARFDEDGAGNALIDYHFDFPSTPLPFTIRQLAISDLCEEAVEWLMDSRCTVTELIVTSPISKDTGGDDDTRDYLQSAPLTFFYGLERKPHVSGNFGRESNISCFESLLPSETLESLAMSIDHSQWSCFIANLVECKNIVSLRLMPPVGADNNLPALMALQIARHCFKPMKLRYIMINDAAVEIVGGTPPDDQLRDAEKAEEASHKLNGTCFHNWTWCWRKDEDDMFCTKCKQRTKNFQEWKCLGYKLRPLDRDETRAIPIFAVRQEVGLCGLHVCEK